MNKLRNYLLSSVLRSAGAEQGGPDNGEREGFDPPSDEGFRNILAFDPFAPPANKGAEGGDGEDPQPDQNADSGKDGGEAAGDGSAPKPPAAPSPKPQSGQANQGGEGDDPLKALREQVQSFLSKAPTAPAAQPTTPQAQPQAPAQGEAPAQPAAAQGQPGAGEQVKYNFNVPDQILDALDSEDRGHRKAALGALVNSLANKLAMDFGTALSALQNHIQSQLPTVITSTVEQHTTQARIKSDLYDNYPELGRLAKTMPGMEEAIWGQIAQVGKQMNVKEWTPEFRDGVGQMLHLNLGIPLMQRAQSGGQPAPQGGANGGQRQPRKPAFSAGSSGGGRPNGADNSSDFLSVLNAGH